MRTRTHAIRKVTALCALIMIAIASSAAVSAAQSTSQPKAAKVGTPGPTVPGVKFNTAAALAGPNCDAAEKLIKIVFLTRPPCVEPFKGNNGGATSPGVTATSIKVVMYMPSDQTVNAGPTKPMNQATGQPGTFEDSIKDMLPVIEHQGWETYGRTVDVDYVTASGTDETAQRADAVSVIALKPFFVADLTGSNVFTTQIAKAKILVISGSGSSADANKQAPYRWLGTADPEGAPLNAGLFAKNTLVGKPAKYGGDDVKSKTRKFGVLTPNNDVDYSSFTNQLPKGSYTTQQYTLSLDPAQIATTVQAQAPTLVSKMKADGVTTIALFGSSYAVASPLMAAATQQGYTPEWFIAGIPGLDVSLIDRLLDQTQAKHLYGLGQVFPPITGTALNQNTAYFDWYWSANQGTYGASSIIAWVPFFQGVMTAGPKLTPKTFQQGMFSMPATGGAATGSTQTYLIGYGKSASTPYNEYAPLGYDYYMYWYDPTAVGVSNASPASGTGRIGFLNAGQRYAASTWPKGDQKFFDSSATMYEEIPSGTPGPGQILLPTVDQFPTYPCTNCPSSGAPAPS